jgi:hypothetical protein
MLSHNCAPSTPGFCPEPSDLHNPPMAITETKNNGGALGFEAELFKAADKLRGNMEPSDYKHVALGLMFLK